MMQSPHIHILSSASGSKLELQFRLPAGTPKAVVQINTGTCIPQKIYWKFADYLSRHGYISVTYDMTDADNFSSSVSYADWIKDMDSVMQYLKQSYPDLPLIVVGHSSGGEFVGTLPSYHLADKIIMVASSNGYWKKMDWSVRYFMWLFWKLLVPYSIRKYGYMNNKMLGVSGGFPKNIILELRDFCMRPDCFLPFLRERGIPVQYDKVNVPVIAYHLGDDKIANAAACRYVLDLHINAPRQFISLRARDYDMKSFGHRGFFAAKAEKLLWPEVLKVLEPLPPPS